jgi:lysophospholipase L1-like esterase
MRAIAAESRDLVYIDVVTPMLAADGTPRADIFIDDRLHMNAKGYAIWRQRVASSLETAKTSASPHCPAAKR